VNASGTTGLRGVLPWLFVLYAAATLLHFAHNAEYLAKYPNLPTSWSRGEVYTAWCCVMALGLLGYGLFALGHRRIGRAILGSYAILGFGGLLHYTRAPMHDHSAMMNVTIWTEAAMGTLLLASVVLVGRITSPRGARWSGKKETTSPVTGGRAAPKLHR
jgi:hypothetical protein